MKRWNRNCRGQTNSPFEGHGLLSLSRQQRKERDGKGGREDATAGCRWCGARREWNRVDWWGWGLKRDWEVQVWAGNAEREREETCQCISIFTLQPRWLSHPVHPSAIPPSLSPPRVSLFPRQPPPMFPWQRSPSPSTPLPTISIANAVIITVLQRRGEPGQERGKTWCGQRRQKGQGDGGWRHRGNERDEGWSGKGKGKERRRGRERGRLRKSEEKDKD